jgi:hypothetical protein
MNPVQEHWRKKLIRLGYRVERALDAEELESETSWGFAVTADPETGNCEHVPYTQIEAHMVAARLLGIGADPEAWLAVAEPIGERDEFAVWFIWFDPYEPDEQLDGGRLCSCICRAANEVDDIDLDVGSHEDGVRFAHPPKESN